MRAQQLGIGIAAVWLGVVAGCSTQSSGQGPGKPGGGMAGRTTVSSGLGGNKPTGGTTATADNAGNGGATLSQNGGMAGMPSTDPAAKAGAAGGSPKGGMAGTSTTMPPAPAKEGRAFVYVGGYDSKIGIFELDVQKATLKAAGTGDGGNNPSYMALHPSGRFAFATNEANGGAVVGFSVEQKTGALTRLNSQPSGSQGTVHLSVAPSGHWLVVTHYTGGASAVMPIGDDGKLGARTQLKNSGKQSHMIPFSPDARFVFVPCKGEDWIAQYRFDAGKGKLLPNDPATVPAAKGSGPRHMAFHPSEKWAYSLGEIDSTLVHWDYDKGKGHLSNGRAQSTLPKEFGEKNSTAHVVVSPDGAFVYASNRGHNSIAIFEIDGKTGVPTFVAHETGGGKIATPRNFTLDPSGKIMLVASQAADHVIVFRRDEKTGLLTAVGAPVPTPGKGPAFVGVLMLPQ